MARYGREDCDHKWRYRLDGWEEECVPTICIECGAFGCLCDSGRDLPWEVFKAEGQNGNANVNGKWINPYVD